MIIRKRILPLDSDCNLSFQTDTQGPISFTFQSSVKCLTTKICPSRLGCDTVHKMLESIYTLKIISAR